MTVHFLFKNNLHWPFFQAKNNVIHGHEVNKKILRKKYYKYFQ